MNLFHFRKARFGVALLLIPPLVIFARTGAAGLRAGIALIALGEFIRLWANGYVGTVKVNQASRQDSKIGMLVTAGPYAFVRNPLYFGSLLMAMGFCAIVGQLLLGAVTVGAFLLVYRQKIQEEERTLAGECGEAFARFCAAVPRLFPTWRRYADRQGRWSWAGIQASREWKTCVWAVVGVIALYFREELVQERELLMGERRLWYAALLAAAAALIALDAGIELVRRRRRPGTA